MNKRPTIVYVLAAGFFLLMPGALAGSTERSLNQLSQSLQSLVDSSNHLVVANDALTVSTNTIRQKVNFLRGKNIGLEKSNAQLKEDLTGYEVKTKNRTGVIEQNQLKIDGSKTRLFKMDQEIEMKKIALAQRQKQQEYVFKLLAIVKGGGTVEQNIQMIKQTQAQLVKQMEEGRRRVEDLEDQWRELSFWYGDPSLSTPQLTKMRDQLKMKLAGLKKPEISDNSPDYKAQIQGLNKDIKGLSKNHSSYSKTLEVVENKYIGKDITAQTRSDEKKLQQTLGRIKKDNKILQRQAADLRFEMIDLDKKKSFLEAALAHNK